METVILSFVVFSLAMLGMAIGVLAGRQPLREGGCGKDCGHGGCGGLKRCKRRQAETEGPTIQ